MALVPTRSARCPHWEDVKEPVFVLARMLAACAMINANNGVLNLYADRRAAAGDCLEPHAQLMHRRGTDSWHGV